jgi:carbonic anhydrase
MRWGLPRAPAERAVVLTCMDARIPPLTLFGMRLGDAHVLRNAGGRVTADIVRSLSVSTWTTGTRSVAVVHHTDCGLLEAAPGDVARGIRAGGGPDFVHVPLLAFGDLAGSVADDVSALRSERLLPRDLTVRGYILDVADGTVREVEVDERGRQGTVRPMTEPPTPG